MRKSTKVFGALAVAGVAAVSGSAFTASNTMPTTTPGKVGYGSTTVSGITVDKVEYVVSTADASKIDQVKFVSTDTGAANSTGTLKIMNGTTVIVGSQSCTLTSAGTAPVVYTFTCDPSPDPAATDFDTVSLTVTKATA